MNLIHEMHKRDNYYSIYYRTLMEKSYNMTCYHTQCSYAMYFGIEILSNFHHRSLKICLRIAYHPLFEAKMWENPPRKIDET